MGDNVNWYILYVSGHEEKRIVSFLNRKYSDWVAFCPMIQKIHRIHSEDVIRLKFMFPNYIFIKSEIDIVEFKRRMFEVRQQKQGIIKDLEYESDEYVSALREEEISYLEHLLNDECMVVPSKGYIKDGRAIITQGPLMGLEDHITKINTHSRNAIVAFKLLNEVKSISLSLIIEK